MSAFHSIGTFINAFNGGTRPNRFLVTGSAPGIGALSGQSGVHAMATSLPESTVGTIPIPFRGRIYKFPGDRDYLPWQVTFLDDVGENGVYSAWHEWSKQFNDHETNLAASRTHLSRYSTDLTVQMLDHNSDVVLRTFILHHAWPMQVGPLELNMANTNQVSTFTCQIAYSYYTLTEQSPAVID